MFTVERKFNVEPRYDFLHYVVYIPSLNRRYFVTKNRLNKMVVHAVEDTYLYRCIYNYFVVEG